MKNIVSVVLISTMCTIMSQPVQANFLEDIFGANHNSKHLNTNSTNANASWYNDRSGRTASGMRATYGVAHKTLPFGTRIHITNPRNGRSVTAVVTDRGPFVRGRNLDVNQNVARSLGFNGIAHLFYSIVH